jgi:hypothetical protein
MFVQWFFRHFSESKKIAFIRKQGIMLGSRVRQGRKVYIYMLRDFFVEVIYQQDDTERSAEKLKVYSSLNNLNSSLAQEFHQAF